MGLWVLYLLQAICILQQWSFVLCGFAPRSYTVYILSVDGQSELEKDVSHCLSPTSACTRAQIVLPHSFMLLTCGSFRK